MVVVVKQKFIYQISMTLYQTIIEEILKEVDPDIRELMMKQEDFRGGAVPITYHGYELIDNPASTILAWQAMRERNKKKS
jgi:hypothetical protein